MDQAIAMTTDRWSLMTRVFRLRTEITQTATTGGEWERGLAQGILLREGGKWGLLGPSKHIQHRDSSPVRAEGNIGRGCKGWSRESVCCAIARERSKIVKETAMGQMARTA